MMGRGERTVDRARGKWRGVLLTLGLDERFLKKTHGPCPFCDGKDRYRWDDKGGNGTFFCSQCGNGDGIELLKRLKGWDFKQVAQAVDEIVGTVRSDPVKPPVEPEQRAEMLRRLWRSGQTLTAGDPAHSYLDGRSALPARLPASLRFTERCPVPNGGGTAPALIALVQAPDGSPASIHRTFLDKLAPGERRRRAMMPGEIAAGSAVRLAEPDGGKLGIGEGIETCLCAGRRFQVPTWAALNSAMLEKWEAPPGIEEVIVFGDNDPQFGGQSSAYVLGHKLSVRRKLKVCVIIPHQVGRDWADQDASWGGV